MKFLAPNSFLRALNPCFLFRPDILARACSRKLLARPERCVVRTAWGDWLEVEPRKFIGAQVYLRGVHELAVCELLWRLTEPGETAVDAGANIGVMTSLLSRKVGARGRVLAFEAHPGVFRQLEQNVRRWERRPIDLFNQALSARAGSVNLCEGDGFAINEGTARVEGVGRRGPRFQVQSVCLDQVPSARAARIMKIDVEGHELEVLLGAASTLAERRLRDVVFESAWGFPGAAHELLQEYDYRVFEIRQSLLGPKLVPLRARSKQHGRLADYLATLEAPRALELVASPGWQVLKRR